MQFQTQKLRFSLLIFFLIFTGLASCSEAEPEISEPVLVTELASVHAANVYEELSFDKVSWSPDNTKLATTEKGGVKIWQFDREDSNGNITYSINNVGRLAALTELRINSLSWAPDDSVIIGGSSDGAWLWDPQTSDVIMALDLEHGAQSFSWSPDRQYFTSSDNGGELRIWEKAKDWQLSNILFTFNDTIREAAWSPDGRWIANTAAYTVYIWDVETGELVHNLKGHKELVGHIEWSPESNHLASTSDDKTIIIWDIEAGSKRMTLYHNTYVSSAAWSPDGTMIASGDSDGFIHLWDPKTGKELLAFDGHASSVTDLDWTKDSKLLASGSLYVGALKIWEVERIDNRDQD